MSPKLWYLDFSKTALIIFISLICRNHIFKKIVTYIRCLQKTNGTCTRNPKTKFQNFLKPVKHARLTFCWYTTTKNGLRSKILILLLEPNVNIPIKDRYTHKYRIWIKSLKNSGARKAHIHTYFHLLGANPHILPLVGGKFWARDPHTKTWKKFHINICQETFTLRIIADRIHL
jgi:hypothetical protein